MGIGSVLWVVVAAATLSAPGGRIVAEWEPGITSAEADGPIVVDGYGVAGLGAYRVQLDDGTVTLAVCIQADVGHSLGAHYEADAATPVPAELAYLAWAHLASGDPDDVTAAAINVLAWRYTGAQRAAAARCGATARSTCGRSASVDSEPSSRLSRHGTPRRRPAVGHGP